MAWYKECAEQKNLEAVCGMLGNVTRESTLNTAITGEPPSQTSPTQPTPRKRTSMPIYMMLRKI